MNEIKYIKKYVEKLYLKNDPSHDFEHIMRVYKNAEKICNTENVNKKLVLISVLLHDIVKKSQSRKSSKSSADLSAEKSLEILKKLKMSKLEINIITEAIRNHSFTKKKISKTIEGRILQDADRLDAIGAIGLARALYCKPKIIILDEATNAMDSNLEEKILKNLHNIKKDKIIILVAHNDEILKKCDKKIEIINGKLN